jgi:uncharacterized protein YbaR (Trm112 family)
LKQTLLDYLRYPLCRKAVALLDAQTTNEVITEGRLRYTGCGQEFTVTNGIPAMFAPQ